MASYTIQIADQTFVAAPVSHTMTVVNSINWSEQWPGLVMKLTQDRGVLGKRWKISGPIEGTMEIWLPEHLDGVLLHYFVHANPDSSLLSTEYNSSGYNFAWDQHGVRRNARRIAFVLKYRAQEGKLPGLPHPLLDDQALPCTVD